MNSHRRKVLDSLQKASRAQIPVRVLRGRGWAADEVNGFIVSMSMHWVVVQSLAETVYFDGYQVVRIDDVTAVEEDIEAGYIDRAITVLGRPTVDFHLSEFAAADEVLRTATQHSELICVHLERAEDYPLLVGRIVRLGGRKFDLQMVGPRGVWEFDSARVWYRDVTRVEFGDRYSRALARFGNAPPAPAGVRDLDSFCRDSHD